MASPTRLRASIFAASALAAATLASAASAQEERPFRDHVVVRVQASTVRQVQAALALTDDLWTHGAGIGSFDMRVSPAQRAALEAAGVPYEVLIPDLEARIDAEFARLAAADGGVPGGEGAEGGVAADDWFLDFKSLAQVDARIDELAAAHPGVAQVIVAGQTFEGRPIRGLRISRAADPDAVPAFLFNGCQHAREWATPMTVMYVADRLLAGATGDPRIASVLERSAVYVIPVVNRDGYVFTWASSANRLWRKNRQPNADGTVGTDPNRNWGYGWGGVGASAVPGDETYRGPSAFSSPEAAALRDFYVAHPRLAASIDFHSYSQLLLWPWGWTNALCPDDAVHRAIGGAMRSAILASAGRSYAAGPIYSTIYPASGGSVDWTYGDQGVVSFTIEVRDTGTYGFVMPPAEILPNVRENFDASMAMMEGALSPAIVEPNGTLPAVLAAGQPTPVSILVTPTTGTVASSAIRVRAAGESSFATVPMSSSGGVHAGQIPAYSCGRTVEYWFEVTTSAGTATYPFGAPSSVLTAISQDSTVRLDETFEGAAAGWTVGAIGDNATAGLWTLVDPVATAAQPEDDHTPALGTRCWITGQGAVGGALGAADVDGGTTTLVSPPLDGTDLAATLSYWRWYSNDRGGAPNADSMPVEWSQDGTAWTQLEDVAENANAWVEKRWPLASFLPAAGDFRLRFRARDLGTGSVVEAGVDDVRIDRIGCSFAPGDLDRDGRVNGADLGMLLSAWGPANGSAADINGDGTVNGSDLGVLLSGWTP